VKDSFTCTGHENVSGMHAKTFMFTTEDYVTPTGDCIVGVNCSKKISDLKPEILGKLKDAETRIRITFESDGVKDVAYAYGSPKLTFTHKSDMVVRKSGFACPRTLAVHADKAASGLDRRIMEKLREGGDLKVTIEVV